MFVKIPADSVTVGFSGSWRAPNRRPQVDETSKRFSIKRATKSKRKQDQTILFYQGWRSLAALRPVPGKHVGEWSGSKVQVPLDGKSQGPAG